MTFAIEAHQLTKRFGPLEVIKGLNLQLPAGRVTGLVGPNAAGKSTLIKLILGLVRPDSGTLTVLGNQLNGNEEYRRQIGYIPQAASFPENLTGREILRLVADLRRSEIEVDLSLLAQFGLETELDKRVRTLSGGTRQKLSAVLALLFPPRLLILDEPTAGLDPVASEILKDRLTECRERGITVLLASHTLSELEEVADDIVFLLDGRVCFHGPIDRLRRLTGFARLEKAVAALMQKGAA